jgi:hypothetical protein
MDGFKDLLVDHVGYRPHQLADLADFERRMAVHRGCGGDGLVHDGERVAHGAVAGFGEQGERGVVGDDDLFARDHLQLADDVVELYGVEAEVLAARADGLRDVLGLRGRKHEDDVVGRLFERLEQRVEGGVCDLVRFIEDDDLVLVARGFVACGVAEFANVFDAAVGGGVDLDDVDGVALADFDAGVASVAGLGGGALGRTDDVAAVERRGKDARDGRLADAAMAGEDVAVGDAVLRECVEQRAGDVVLPDDVGEELGAVLAG